jgi:NADH:ubiquinone oxidoreductase subunit 3 (subunit A)
MQLLVFTVIGLVLFLLAIGFDLGGTIGVLIFLLVLLIGVAVRASSSIIDWARGPASKL